MPDIPTKPFDYEAAARALQEQNEALHARLDALKPTIADDPVKPGYLTTEFIGKSIVQIISMLVLFGVVPIGDKEHAQEIALGLMTAAEAVYGYSRSLVKKKAAVAVPVAE